MTEAFEAALARVKSFQLGTLGEEAIKQGVILPLLRAVGWDTDDISQVNPEYQTGKGFVDYSLRIGDENRVFVEAKAGGVDLKFCENQLQEYCRANETHSCGFDQRRPLVALCSYNQQTGACWKIP